MYDAMEMNFTGQNKRYVYQPIPPRSIRLVNIVSSHTSPHGFALSFNEYPLDSLPPFWALSYTWGSPDFPTSDADADADAVDWDSSHRVDCGTGFLEIGQNLLAFLRQTNLTMSQPAAATPPEPRQMLPERPFNFWIDAVCINQADPAERTQQVRHMGRIYQSARRVVAWLGPAEPSADATWVVREFAPRVLALAGGPRHDDASRREAVRIFAGAGPSLQQHAAGAAALLGENVCRRWRERRVAFFAFFARKRWLTRGWVVQEAALPRPGRVVLQCGGVQLSWAAVNDFASFVYSAGWDAQLDAELAAAVPAWRARPGTLERLWNPVAAALSEYDRRGGVGERVVVWQRRRWGAVTDCEVRHAEVLHNLHRLRAYEFENPLDRIYGALGLCERILGDRYAVGVAPRYDVSVEAAFTGVAAWLLGFLPNLDVLGLAGLAEGRMEGLPSWVPDYSFRGPRGYTSLQRVRQLFKDGRSFHPLDATRAGNGGRQGRFARTDGETRLVLEGACVDTVGKLHRLEHDERGVLANVSWVVDFCNREGRYAVNETFAAAVVTTLSANIKPRAILKHEYRESVEQWARDCVAYNCAAHRGDPALDVADRLDFCEAGSAKGRSLFMSSDDVSQAVSLDGFAEKMADDPITKVVHFVTPGRKALETRRGLVGLGPAEAKCGDEVWLVNGGRMPLLLRRLETVDKAAVYVLVGEVYLHGVMHGEMMTDELRAGFRPVVMV
ncbi:Heterokaryon incompatibility protein 6, OR allele [Colletotrichum sidae]|uniref:Heterokaryon incompatibility protein 6, OR allele n=1 Tax=Colletotrichum sidae TaxID=1347389 RepID=A0A4R8T6L4_9PEZI|nr:Heterokaryon incompatibility protein 6, OR allele [Colletotrichum sidae]